MPPKHTPKSSAELQGLLWQAADRGDARGISRAISLGAQPDLPDAHGLHASQRLAFDGSGMALAALLAGGADPRLAKADDSGRTLCHLALAASPCQGKSTASGLACLRALVAAGADPWVQGHTGLDTMSVALHVGDLDAVGFLLGHAKAAGLLRGPHFLARHVTRASSQSRDGALALLLAAGADPNERQGRGWGSVHLDGLTCLQLAIQGNVAANVQTLLDHGADPSLSLTLPRAGSIGTALPPDTHSIGKALRFAQRLRRPDCERVLAGHASRVEKACLEVAAGAPSPSKAATLRV